MTEGSCKLAPPTLARRAVLVLHCTVDGPLEKPGAFQLDATTPVPRRQGLAFIAYQDDYYCIQLKIILLA
jgi:hypothetical protein